MLNVKMAKLILEKLESLEDCDPWIPFFKGMTGFFNFSRKFSNNEVHRKNHCTGKSCRFKSFNPSAEGHNFTFSVALKKESCVPLHQDNK